MSLADQEARLTSRDIVEGDTFGSSVSLSGDRALVGVPGDDDTGSRSGSAYVFVRSGTTWTQEAKLVATDAGAWHDFGSAVSLSGDLALVGASNAQIDGPAGPSTGAAYVFLRTGTTWMQEARLTASDGGQGDRFGLSVALDGDRALIGAQGDDDAGPESGSAYVFVRSGSTWRLEDKLTSSDGESEDRFGSSVSLSGNRALVGAPNDKDNLETRGSAYVFVLPPTATVGTQGSLSDGVVIGRATPNPVRSIARVSVEVTEAQQVRAEVFTMLGQHVATVLDGAVTPGAAIPVVVDVSALAPGSYIVRITGEMFVESRRLTVVR